MSGTKYDDGKLRFDLIPVAPLRQLAEVYTIGAKKYSDRNWEAGVKYHRIYGALQRHANAWWSGEKYDKENGQHHLAAVVFNAFALMEFEETHPDMDDRPIANKETIMCGECEQDYPYIHVCKDPEKEYIDMLAGCQGTD